MSNDKNILRPLPLSHQPIKRSPRIPHQTHLRRLPSTIRKPSIINSQHVRSKTGREHLVVPHSRAECPRRGVAVEEQDDGAMFQRWDYMRGGVVGWGGQRAVVGVREDKPCAQRLVVGRLDLEVECTVCCGSQRVSKMECNEAE